MAKASSVPFLFLFALLAFQEPLSGLCASIDPSNPVIRVAYVLSFAEYSLPTVTAEFDSHRNLTVYHISNYSSIELEEDWAEGVDGALTALVEINAAEWGSLSNYTIQPFFVDSKENEVDTVKGLLQLPLETIHFVFFAESAAAPVICDITNGMDIPALSAFDSSGIYSTGTYPLVTPFVHSSSAYADAMVHTLDYIGCTQFVVVATGEQSSLSFLGAFAEVLNEPDHQHISLARTIPMIRGPEAELPQLLDTQHRVVLLSADWETGENILRVASTMGLVGPGSPYIWITYGNCRDITDPALAYRPYIQGLLCLSSPFRFDEHTNAEFSEELMDFRGKLETDFADQLYDWELARSTYDGSKVMAAALDSMIKLKIGCASNFSFDPLCAELQAGNVTESQVITQYVKTVTVSGLEGNLTLSDLGDHVELSLYQAHWDAATNTTEWNAKISIEIIDDIPSFTRVGSWEWQTGESEVPPFFAPPVPNYHTPSQNSIIAVDILAGLAILFGLFCIGFCVKYIHVNAVKVVAPRINIVSAFGSILLAVCAIVLGSDPPSDASCTALIWMVPISFSLQFGGMFAKVYRVVMIFNRRMEKKVLSDWQLIPIVAAFVAVDVFFAAAMSLPDAMQARTYLISSEYLVSGDIHHLRWGCSSTRAPEVLYVFLALKAIVLFSCLVLTFKTRKVHIRELLSDSKWVSVCVYSTALIVFILLPLQFTIYDSLSGPALGYIITAVGLVVLAFLNLAFLFVPKMSEVLFPDTGVKVDMISLGGGNHTHGSGHQTSNHAEGPKKLSVNVAESHVSEGIKPSTPVPQSPTSKFGSRYGQSDIKAADDNHPDSPRRGIKSTRSAILAAGNSPRSPRHLARSLSSARGAEPVMELEVANGLPQLPSEFVIGVVPSASVDQSHPHPRSLNVIPRANRLSADEIGASPMPRSSDTQNSFAPSIASSGSEMPTDHYGVPTGVFDIPEESRIASQSRMAVDIV